MIKKLLLAALFLAGIGAASAQNIQGTNGSGGGGGGSGTVTSVGLTAPGIFTITGSPVTTSGTLGLVAAGTSGGVPYFNSATTLASSGVLAANALVIGGGTGAAPSTTTTGTGVLTALGLAVSGTGSICLSSGSACAGGGGSPGGSNTQVQYNNSSAFGGISGVTSNGTLMTFASSDLVLGGSSTGTTAFASDNAGASNFTTHFPANTGVVAELNLAQTFSAGQSFTSSSGSIPVDVSGSVGNIALKVHPATSSFNEFLTVGTTGITGNAVQNTGGTLQWGVESSAGGNITTTGYSPYMIATQTVDFFLGTKNSFAQLVLKSNGLDVAMPSITTGTNVDFACFSSGLIVTIQSSACTISSKRFKNQFAPFSASALAELGQLPIAQFTMKPSWGLDAKTKKWGIVKNKDPNFGSKQLGLYAEDVAKMDPRCAVYENDMKTPKSYRQECIIALLVKGEQELKAANDHLAHRVALLEHR